MTSQAVHASAIDALLPQTQCTRCGYAGCAPYAAAIASGAADINRCPPGGRQTIERLAALTGRPARALDAACGTHAPLQVAVIDAERCIGCTLCIDACPVDAIVGAAKRLHGVLSSLCSGCELCIAPCPVDCITMDPGQRTWSAEDAAAARTRHQQRNARVARGERIALRSLTPGPVLPRSSPLAAAAMQAPGAMSASATSPCVESTTARNLDGKALAANGTDEVLDDERAVRRAVVAAALARARARRHA